MASQATKDPHRPMTLSDSGTLVTRVERPCAACVVRLDHTTVITYCSTHAAAVAMQALLQRFIAACPDPLEMANFQQEAAGLLK